MGSLILSQVSPRYCFGGLRPAANLVRAMTGVPLSIWRARYLFERAFQGIELAFSACVTHLPQDELLARQRHEEQALARLIAEETGSRR